MAQDTSPSSASSAPDESLTRLVTHGGIPYGQFLGLFRRQLPVKSYFEIGSRAGGSLAGVQCDTVAVDPAFRIEINVIGSKSALMLFQMTSDSFFEKYDLSGLLGGPVDMAFLDGLHIFEYLLRDFMNTERHMKRNGVICLHDCLPQIFGMTTREARLRSGVLGWTGDVWKVVPILQKYRPDLKIYCLDCPPTGLVMVTGLDPSSRILDDAYFDIVEEFRESEDDLRKLEAFYDAQSMLETREITAHSDFAKLCWL